MTTKYAPDEQINVLQYITEVWDQEPDHADTTVQEMLDTFVAMMVVYKHAPRIYEVTEDGQSITFNTRTMDGWDTLLREAALRESMDKLVDKLMSVLAH